MSGSSITSGIMIENEERNSEFERLMDLKIRDLSIQIIPLKSNVHINRLRFIGQFLQLYIHPAILSPTLSHIAIQLNMENGKDIIIMEYGQYLTEQSEIDEPGIFSSCDSCSNDYKRPKRSEKNNIFWFLNKDGLRLTKIDENDTFFKEHQNLDENKKSEIVSELIACNHYGIDHQKFKEINSKLLIGSLFNCVNCKIKNEITLKELCENFKGEKWEAKSYNWASHNCQHFAAEIIKILKAERLNDLDKIRTVEKLTLPNCIISALWDNEELSFVNTMGRIPLVGLIYDLVKISKA